MKNESILSKLNDLQSFDFSTFRMHTALVVLGYSLSFSFKRRRMIRVIKLIWFSDIFYNPCVTTTYHCSHVDVSWGILENSLNLSILLSERKETKWDVLSSGEWNGHSSTSNPTRSCEALPSIWSKRERCFFWILNVSVLDWWLSLEVTGSRNQ